MRDIPEVKILSHYDPIKLLMEGPDELMKQTLSEQGGTYLDWFDKPFQKSNLRPFAEKLQANLKHSPPFHLASHSNLQENLDSLQTQLGNESKQHLNGLGESKYTLESLSQQSLQIADVLRNHPDSELINNLVSHSICEALKLGMSLGKMEYGEILNELLTHGFNDIKNQTAWENNGAMKSNKEAYKTVLAIASKTRSKYPSASTVKIAEKILQQQKDIFSCKSQVPEQTTIESWINDSEVEKRDKSKRNISFELVIH
ncbi:hypothetical protein AHAT_41620 [Agarivorans sp. Toyoura001]|uniref:hypothetical protein n=1 Tax=Agarivorans sp. Toyoura001 TaxID=2283141 RepID=UPI0010DD9CD6|nr:hypothetical protein [Agarivorans sp. Toyoura001]GDY28272.1 hypothetical protein AHAT_41620 [Agarivorans sp. Toyoura001]